MCMDVYASAHTHMHALEHAHTHTYKCLHCMVIWETSMVAECSVMPPCVQGNFSKWVQGVQRRLPRELQKGMYLVRWLRLPLVILRLKEPGEQMAKDSVFGTHFPTHH